MRSHKVRHWPCLRPYLLKSSGQACFPDLTQHGSIPTCIIPSSIIPILHHCSSCHWDSMVSPGYGLISFHDLIDRQVLIWHPFLIKRLIKILIYFFQVGHLHRFKSVSMRLFHQGSYVIPSLRRIPDIVCLELGGQILAL